MRDGAMATPGQVIAQFSDVFHVELSTMTTFNHKVHVAGLLSRGGRGRSAVHRNPLDAARLMIALLGTNSPVRAAEVVHDFGILECREVEFGDADGLTLETLCGPELGEVHSFECALEGLIAGFGRADFRALLKANVRHVGRMAHYPDII